jgi:peptidoglycan/xylan/chitin deacetylase (PgdA/CDA1 family)
MTWRWAVYLIITIDVEEDNWGEYDPHQYSLCNLKKIPRLHELLKEFSVEPTYLVNYPVASDPWSAEMFSEYARQGNCEIGMHCHPWNTPPFKERICESNTMLCNLPAELQYMKLKYLHDTVVRNIGISPVSFRAGRWGFNAETAKAIRRLGFKVDTSVTPLMNWKESRGPDFSLFGPEPFRFECDDLSKAVGGGPLLQVPATVGFLQSNFRLCRLLNRAAESRIGRLIHLKGILYRCGVLNQAWLSPELSDTETMIRLAKRFVKNNYSCLNFTFHSTSLKEGLSPFVGVGEEGKFLKKIEEFLRFARFSGFETVTLKEFERRHSRLRHEGQSPSTQDRSANPVNGHCHAVNE